ncbi:MAG: hypothetical protein ISS88_03385 [Candidatus Portnoybacteria bacterium]|nr:hypothetical protein [Candidatus Portnoybacteria bacterium]
MKKLPLKTILVALILAIGLILFVGSYSKKGAFSQINIWGGKETIIESQDKDTDSDGLRDWEEELYKTSPYDPDTDNDGYLDGEEINSGHNPLVKGPGDEIFLFPLPLGEKYNITQHIFQNSTASLLNSYLFHKFEYIEDHPEITDPTNFLASLPESIQRELINQAIYDNFLYIMENSKEIFSQFPEIFDVVISDQQINIVQDNNKETIQIYLSKLSSLINSDNFFFKKTGTEILLNIFETEDFSRLNEVIKLNNPTIEQIKQISVPFSLKEIHKQGLKTAILTRNIFISVRDLENDPIKAFLFAQKIDEVFNNWLNLLEKISDLTKEYNISYE